jgi:hypothetical protein
MSIVNEAPEISFKGMLSSWKLSNLIFKWFSGSVANILGCNLKDLGLILIQSSSFFFFPFPRVDFNTIHAVPLKFELCAHPFYTNLL